MIRSLEKGQQVIIEAPAKVNLYLEIVAKRPDGYHDIQTLMVKLQLVDLLTIKKSHKGIQLVCPGSNLPADESNLAYRAAQLFIQDQSIHDGIEIRLEKKIPIAAGLGGGSSDAAAVLLGLGALFGTRITEKHYVDLARKLGADVPFFVTDCVAAWGTGIGDKLQKIDLQIEKWFVLVNPGFSVSTKWVYTNFALTTGGNTFILGRKLEHDKINGSLLASEQLDFFNDLESVTVKRYPEIGEIKKKLIAGGAKGALMSGSGPTVFGVFENEDDAKSSYREFSKQYSDVFITKAHQ